MKTKIIFSIALVGSLLLNSCSDYLDEINKTGKTADLVYSDEKNVDGLVAAAYSYLRLWYGKEASFNLSEGGTDIWYNASDNKAIDLVTYKNVSPDPAADLANNNSCLDEYWEAFYAAVNLCNLAEQVVTDANFLTVAKKTRLISEVRYLRAFYYWHMVEIWGPVPLNMKVIADPATSATRNSVDEIYAQMFIDVQYAIDNLIPGAPSSRVTYWAAKAFKARLALYYASEYGKTEYFATAAQEAQDVITNSGKSLYTNYADVWDIKKSSTTTNSEFIWAVDYFDVIGDVASNNFLPIRLKLDASGNPLLWSSNIIRRTPANGSGGGNIMHVTCTPVWQNQTNAFGGASLVDVLVRNAGLEATPKYYSVASPSTKVQVDLGYWYVKYGLGYARFAPTRYLLDLYDETSDQRYNGTFRTAWYKHPTLVPKWYGTKGNPSNPKDTCMYPKMSTGTQTDTCLYWSKRPLTAEQLAWAKGRYKVFDVSWTFKADGVTPDVDGAKGTAKADQMFAMLKKFENTDSKITLPATTFQDYFSYRDVPVFRISEMYLIAAEALMGTDQAGAVNVFNQLRAKRAIPTKEAAMTVATVDQKLILEERAREFAGEYIRWFDLKRTKTLETQIVNNTNAKDFFNPTKHYLRPIPSSQMNAVSNPDTSNTQEPGTFWQNPGY
jgi:hypothetical protein